MLRKVLFFVSAIILVALGFLALSGQTKGHEVRVDDPRMAGLMSCMVKNICNIPRSVETISGIEVISLSYQESGEKVKILFKGQKVFGINVRMKDGRQVVVDDLDLDGLVDLVYIDEGDGQPVISFSTQDDSRVLESIMAQKVLHESLQSGWDNFVPDDIKDEIKRKLAPTATNPGSPDLERFKV